jgi:hypothetical protein
MPLEQQRHGGQPLPLVVVIGRQARDRSVGSSDSADDDAEHIGEFRSDQHSLNSGPSPPKASDLSLSEAESATAEETARGSGR